MKMDFPTLGERLKVLLLNAVLFYVLFRIFSGLWVPSGGLESVWLFSALALWFLSLLSSPWFVPPRDTLVNAIGALSILVTIDLSNVMQFRGELEIVRWASVVIGLTAGVMAVIALLLHEKSKSSSATKLSYKLTSIIGKGELLYTPPALISILGAYQNNFSAIAWLTIAWVVFVVAKPVELAFAARRYWLGENSSASNNNLVGIISRIDDPNIVRVTLTKNSKWEIDTLHVAAMPNGKQRYLLPLSVQIQGTEVVGTGLCIADVSEHSPIEIGEVCLSHDSAMTSEFLENLSGTKGASIAGFTVENTRIETLRFEVSANANLSEGDVVSARIKGQDVFYQIIDAETAEESFDKNPRGTQIVEAAQLGVYDLDAGFTKYPWLPAMNTPLFIAKGRDFGKSLPKDREFVIGKVPSADIEVRANIDDLAEFHTAILGVTGTGKTELALDIVREAIKRGQKIFCVDFTGDYRERLADLNPEFPSPTAAQAAELEAKLFAVDTGDYGAKAEKKVLKTAIDALRTTAKSQVSTFLESADKHLAILELGEITNTKATLRMTELYLSTIMEWAREHRKARQILIVLEEAHTIIPETFSAGYDEDTKFVVSKIGQIALQGRKYGAGLLVVSQRTALVSKTILSQCNAFLTHSLIDQTSLDFLRSVYSTKHVNLIPNLGKFEFLAFGKGIRSERPILLRRDFDPKKVEASNRLRKPLVEDIEKLDGAKP